MTQNLTSMNVRFWRLKSVSALKGLDLDSLRRMYVNPTYFVINPLTAKLFNCNFHPLEAVSRWRDPQLQVSENYSDLTKWRSTLFKSCWLMSYYGLKCGTECGNNWVKTPIYSAPAVKGLTNIHYSICSSGALITNSIITNTIGKTNQGNFNFLSIACEQVNANQHVVVLYSHLHALSIVCVLDAYHH